jgi:hypothetical protein
MMHAKLECSYLGRDPEAVATQLKKTIYDPALSQEHRMVTTKYAPTIRVSGFRPFRICERNSGNTEATGNLQATNNDYPENSEGMWDRLQKTWSVTGEVGFFHHAVNGNNSQPSQESGPSGAQSSTGASTDEDVSAQAATLRLSLDLSDLIPHVAQKLEFLTDYDSDAFEIKNVSTRDMLVAVRILPVPSNSGNIMELTLFS